MADVIRTPRAVRDLYEIWSFIADDNPDAADKLMDDLARTCRMLAEDPGFGRSREELAPGLRSFPVGNYLVFYRARPEGILVIRVLHGARDLPALF